MNAPDGQELLAEYVRKGSEQAFRELLGRYLDLVYSTALRSVAGDTHKAEDIAQTVFLDLARLASKLSKDTLLGGWLHRHTCYVAATLMRAERRRQARERQALEMNTFDDSNDPGLSHLAPVLDAAINELDEEDRKAILLRFYERLDLRSVGQALGSSENAAQKRVSRALDQLHLILTRRGVTLSAAALSAVLAGEAVTAAPAGLAASVVSTALAGAAAGAGISVTLVKVSALTKLKVGFIAALAVGSVTTTLWLQHQAQLKLRAEDELLRQQLAQQARLRMETEALANALEETQTIPKPVPTRRPPVAEALKAETPRLASAPAGVTVGPSRSSAPTVTGGLLYSHGGQLTRFFAKSGSRMKIEGTSNIHDWQVESSLISGFIEVGPNFPSEPGQRATPGRIVAQAEPFIMVRSLKSVEKDGKPYSDRMDEVMYEHLKAVDYPKIAFHLTELTLKEAAKGKERPHLFEAKGELVVAGVTNLITMPVSILPLREKDLKITGSLTVKMTDFQIDPPVPTLALGLIRTDDEVKLSFEWMLSQRDPKSQSSKN